MDSFRYVIAGSGPAGVSAARRLAGSGVCIVDVGDTPRHIFPFSSLREGLAAGDIQALLGPHWETLSNLVEPRRVHTKVRAAGIQHVLQGEQFRVNGAKGEPILSGSASYAAGGMSNAWGAQLFRYTEADLLEAGNWPLTASELIPYYADLEQHIGISGLNDDLTDFLGLSTCLLPPAPIVPAAQHLLERYSLKKAQCHVAGLRLGHSRLALLTEKYQGYSTYGFGETEFFTTVQPGIYTARRTLEELRQNERITYVGRHKLMAYRERPEHVEIDLLNIEDGVSRTIRAQHLLLGCGTMQTARLVLLNKREGSRSLPFIDHPPTLLPVFLPKLFGSSLPTASFPVQLVASLQKQHHRDMISMYYPGALLWTDLLADIPLPMDAALKILGYLLGGMLVAQIWETSRPSPNNRLLLDSKGEIQIDYPDRKPYVRLQPLIAAFRHLGAYTLKRLASMSPPGWGFHYAACLPMRRNPGPYETHIDGRLWDSKRVRVIDGSVLPSLPAKNHSLTLMANAARIADSTQKCGY